MSVAGNMITTLGVVSGTLGIVNFLRTNFGPTPHTPAGAIVQIKLGLGDDTTTDLGGGINSVWGFDINNNYLGQGKGGWAGQGGVIETVIDQAVPGAQADYVSVAAITDAVCISWISVKQSDGSPSGAWTGDIGRYCGLQWYHGNQQAGNYEDGSPYSPKCSWLDADHGNGIANAALKFRTRAYGEEAKDTIASSTGCDATTYGPDEGPISGKPSEKRSLSTRPAWMQSQLVVSNITDQSAEDLCKSENSYGPDFIDGQGNFCDMKTKTLTPGCNSNHFGRCVEVDLDTSEVKMRTSVARRSASVIHKSYDSVRKW